MEPAENRHHGGVGQLAIRAGLESGPDARDRRLLLFEHDPDDGATERTEHLLDRGSSLAGHGLLLIHRPQRSRGRRRYPPDVLRDRPREMSTNVTMAAPPATATPTRSAGSSGGL